MYSFSFYRSSSFISLLYCPNWAFSDFLTFMFFYEKNLVVCINNWENKNNTFIEWGLHCSKYFSNVIYAGSEKLCGTNDVVLSAPVSPVNMKMILLVYPRQDRKVLFADPCSTLALFISSRTEPFCGFLIRRFSLSLFQNF